MSRNRCVALGLWAVLPAFGVLGCPAPAAAGVMVTALDSQVRAYTEARAVSGNPLVVDNRPASQGASINGLSASASSTSQAGAAQVVTTSQASATWTSSYHATVKFENLGWTTANVVSGRAAFSAE